jgi:hypothetical protein
MLASRARTSSNGRHYRPSWAERSLESPPSLAGQMSKATLCNPIRQHGRLLPLTPTELPKVLKSLLSFYPSEEKPVRPLNLRIIILMEVPVDLSHPSIYCMEMITIVKAASVTLFALSLATDASSQTPLPEWLPAQFFDLSLVGDAKANFPALWDSEIKASAGATTIKEAHVMTRTDRRGLVISILGSESLCRPIKGDPATGEVWSCPTKLIITNFQQQPVSVVQDLCFLSTAENSTDPKNLMAFAVDSTFTSAMAQTYFQGILVPECSVTIAVPVLPDAQDPMTYMPPN